MAGFQRARSDEQREVRRRAILDAAAAMLAEMPVAEVTLTALSRRSGLAKSNVLRYFDSREAVLLELLERASGEWLAALTPALAPLRAGSPAAAGAGRAEAGPVAGSGLGRSVAAAAGLSVGARREDLAAALAASLASRPVLCDLLSAQAAVLERNVSPAVAARFKRGLLELGELFTAAVREVLPELTAPAASQFAAAAMLLTGATWAAGQPSAAMVAAYEADPELAALRLDVEATLRDLFAVLLAGLLAR